MIEPTSWVIVNKIVGDSEPKHTSDPSVETLIPSTLFKLFWPIRSSKPTNQEYKGTLQDRGARQYASLRPGGLISDLSNNFPPLVEDQDFERAAACFDMFWEIYPDAKHSAARMGSLVLRDRVD